MAAEPYAAGSSAYLEDLLEGEPTFQFTSVNNLERTVERFHDQTQREYLVFKDVPYDTFQQLGNNRYSIVSCCRFLYIHNTKSVRIKIPSKGHGAASGEFNKLLIKKLTLMDVIDDITSRHSQLRRIGNVSKQPDGAWGPLVPQHYATCVLEVGLSESAQ
jgi:hypothetical protein